MKKLRFEVEIPELGYEMGTFESIIRCEGDQEIIQFDITKRINTATTLVHKKILKGIMESIENEVEFLGLQFDIAMFKTRESNNYHGWIAKLRINGITTYEIKIKGRIGSVDGTKYSTYPGDYDLGMTKDGASSWRNFTEVNDVLGYMRDDLIRFYKKHKS